MDTPAMSVGSSTQALTTTSIPTLADVMIRVAEVDSLSRRTRTNIRSTIRAFCRAAGNEPQSFPLEAPLFCQMLEPGRPEGLLIPKERWHVIKSTVRRGVRLTGFATYLREVKVDPLPEVWSDLARLGPTKSLRSALRRFARYCRSQHLTPLEVTDETAYQYGEYLRLNGLTPRWRRYVTDLIKTWNRIDEAGPSLNLPRLSPPVQRRLYAIKRWADISEALAADVEVYLQACRCPDPLDPHARRPLRESTIFWQDGVLRRLATGEIALGVSRERLLSLADLVRPDHLTAGLRFLLRRNRNQLNTQTFEVAKLALAIARDWVKAPEGQLDELRRLVKRVQVIHRGLSEKNRLRLHQFSDRRILASLITLPERIFAEMRDAPLTRQTAVRVQTAVALALIIVAPIRISNLVRLDWEQHFAGVNSRNGRDLHLFLDRVNTKNSVKLEYPIPTEVARLIDAYLETYQPLLSKSHPSSLLFPGRTGEPKRRQALRFQIVETVRDRLGINFNPHLARHLAAFLFLTAHPGQYEGVRRLLGHRELNGTIRAYCGLDMIGAGRIFDDMVIGQRMLSRITSPDS